MGRALSSAWPNPEPVAEAATLDVPGCATRPRTGSERSPRALPPTRCDRITNLRRYTHESSTVQIQLRE